MKYSYHILTLLGIFLILSACKKTDIPDISDSKAPLFKIEGTLGDMPIKIQAGINDAYMFTEVKTFNNLPLYTGELGTKLSSFQIYLFSSDIDIPYKTGKFNALEAYPISMPYGEETLLKIAAEDFYNHDIISNINWTIDGVAQNSSTLEIFEPGKYNICAEVIFNTGIKTKTCNSVNVGYKQNANAQIHYQLNENNSYFSLESDTEVSTVKWFINNQQISSESSFSSNDLPEDFHLKAEVQFTNGTQLSREIYINRANNENSVEDFTSLGYHTDIEWDNAMDIKIHHNGNYYRAINNSNSSLIVEEIKNFKNNKNGEKVKLIIGEINTQFINLETQEVIDGSFKIQFGIAHDN